MAEKNECGAMVWDAYCLSKYTRSTLVDICDIRSMHVRRNDMHSARHYVSDNNRRERLAKISRSL
jgi:hypothetical protein